MAGLCKPRLQKALIETLSNTYLQRCAVSGTPKGKKTGQVLKRSKITRKKTTPPSSSPSSAKSSEFDKLVVECLNAPSPLRHLTPKQRAREEEREKMGLFSRDRKREIEMTKEREKRKAQNKEGEEEEEKPHLQMGAPGFDFVTLGMVDMDRVPKYELTAEDGKRLAKQYSRVLMLHHRWRQNAETTLVKLKKAAIKALPLHLQQAALVPDYTPFPPGRIIPSLTPPIPGYADSLLQSSKKHSDLRQRRS